MDEIDPVTGAVRRVGEWQTLEGELIRWEPDQRNDGSVFSPDGRALLAWGSAPGVRVTPGSDVVAYRIDLESGVIERVPTDDGWGVRWSADGRVELPVPVPERSPSPAG